MPPKQKKPPKNAYYFYMRKRREELEKEGYRFPQGIKDVAVACGPEWAAMTPEEKLPYEEEARKHKEDWKIDITNKFTSTGESYASVQEKQLQERRLAEEQELCIKELATSGKVPERIFVLIKAVHCVEEIVKKGTRVYWPLEISLVAFNLKEGLKSNHWTLVDIQKAPVGYASAARECSLETGLPEPGKEMMSSFRDYSAIFHKIRGFIKYWTKSSCKNGPVVFAMDSEATPIRGCLRWLAERTQENKQAEGINFVTDLKIYRLPKLILRLAEYANSLDPSYSNILTEQKLEHSAASIVSKGCYDFKDEISCAFHTTERGSVKMPNCCRNICLRRMYLLFEEFVPALKIEKTKRHSMEELKAAQDHKKRQSALNSYTKDRRTNFNSDIRRQTKKFGKGSRLERVPISVEEEDWETECADNTDYKGSCKNNENLKESGDSDKNKKIDFDPNDKSTWFKTKSNCPSTKYDYNSGVTSISSKDVSDGPSITTNRETKDYISSNDETSERSRTRYLREREMKVKDSYRPHVRSSCHDEYDEHRGQNQRSQLRRLSYDREFEPSRKQSTRHERSPRDDGNSRWDDVNIDRYRSGYRKVSRSPPRRRRPPTPPAIGSFKGIDIRPKLSPPLRDPRRRLQRSPSPLRSGSGSYISNMSTRYVSSYVEKEYDRERKYKSPPSPPYYESRSRSPISYSTSSYYPGSPHSSLDDHDRRYHNRSPKRHLSVDDDTERRFDMEVRSERERRVGVEPVMSFATSTNVVFDYGHSASSSKRRHEDDDVGQMQNFKRRSVNRL